MLQHIIAQAQATTKPVENQDVEIQLMDDTVAQEEIQVNENNLAIDALITTADSYQVLAQTCFAAAKTGGFDENAINALIAGVQGTGAMIGDKVDLPSGESFEEAGGRVDATMLTGESLKDRAKDLYKTVKDFIMRQVNKLKELWKTHFSKLGRMKKTIDAAQQKYAKVEGTQTKAKFKINLKAIFKGNAVASASEVVSEATGLKGLPKALEAQAKTAKELAAEIGSGSFSDIIAKLSSVEGVVEVKGSKEADAATKKQTGMTEGYSSVKVTADLLSGDTLVIGTPTSDSAKGPRSKWVAGKVDEKKANAEHDTLSATDIGAYLDAAAAQRDLADELTVAISSYTDAMGDLAKKLDKANDAEGDAKADAEKAIKKIQDYTSLASDGIRGLIGHCVSASQASFNYAVASAKLYKEEK